MAKTLWKTRTTRLDAQSQAQAQETVPPLTAEPLGRNLPALEPTLAPTPVVEPAVQRPGADPARPAVGAVPEGIDEKAPAGLYESQQPKPEDLLNLNAEAKNSVPPAIEESTAAEKAPGAAASGVKGAAPETADLVAGRSVQYAKVSLLPPRLSLPECRRSGSRPLRMSFCGG